ncbi:MarR family winged helix-turn-helix transcriptional regulator [Demequina lutea]|uniref:DNA-binding MarR family transcriptional regulator n=1 Tax=Demequina lutea TaxID=431489 RepID=A0A7Y9ZAA1_9MICO|nr:MarR family transcriptional regulator [Demequina lutea]NYI41709.1 DNA-binding MarR family transcriptional regulator [Demequina lutea]
MDKETTSLRPAVEQAILALRRLNSALMVSNRVVGARLHINNADLAVLDTLHQDGPQTPTELAHRTRTHLATMTGILTRLERDGWIERRLNEVDRRSASIHATGVDRLTDAYVRANERLARLLASWTLDEVALLTRFLSDASEIVTTSTEETDHVSSCPPRASGASA